MKQTILNGIESLSGLLKRISCQKLFLVVDSSFPFLNIKDVIEGTEIPSVKFSDFTPNPLYALESKKPLKEFDAIGFSLQYEMAYTTVLKMLEMANIPYKNSERTDDDPIIIAGGPCTFNPLPMSDFIDIFMIGDGEDAIIEICKTLEETKGQPRKEIIKKLCQIEGCWSKGINRKVNKRISQLKPETAITSYPIPFSSSVQDRAVVEIRRGCGRQYSG